MEETPNELAIGLKSTVGQVTANQDRRNQFLEQQEKTLQVLQGQNALLASQNQAAENRVENQEHTLVTQQTVMQQQSLDCQMLVQRLESLFVDQSQRQGMHEKATLELRESLKDMRIRNRNRDPDGPSVSSQSWDFRNNSYVGAGPDIQKGEFGPSSAQQAKEASQLGNPTSAPPPTRDVWITENPQSRES